MIPSQMPTPPQFGSPPLLLLAEHQYNNNNNNNNNNNPNDQHAQLRHHRRNVNGNNLLNTTDHTAAAGGIGAHNDVDDDGDCCSPPSQNSSSSPPQLIPVTGGVFLDDVGNGSNNSGGGGFFDSSSALLLNELLMAQQQANSNGSTPSTNNAAATTTAATLLLLQLQATAAAAHQAEQQQQQQQMHFRSSSSSSSPTSPSTLPQTTTTTTAMMTSPLENFLLLLANQQQQTDQIEREQQQQQQQQGNQHNNNPLPSPSPFNHATRNLLLPPPPFSNFANLNSNPNIRHNHLPSTTTTIPTDSTNSSPVQNNLSFSATSPCSHTTTETTVPATLESGADGGTVNAIGTKASLRSMIAAMLATNPGQLNQLAAFASTAPESDTRTPKNSISPIQTIQRAETQETTMNLMPMDIALPPQQFATIAARCAQNDLFGGNNKNMNQLERCQQQEQNEWKHQTATQKLATNEQQIGAINYGNVNLLFSMPSAMTTEISSPSVSIPHFLNTTNSIGTASLWQSTPIVNSTSAVTATAAANGTAAVDSFSLLSASSSSSSAASSPSSTQPSAIQHHRQQQQQKMSNNVATAATIRSQRAPPLKEIITLDDPRELDEFMARGEEQCILDMRAFIAQFSLRQTTVAMMTGVSQPYISKLLNGNHRELSLRCRKNIYCWYLNCRRHPEKLAMFIQDPSSRLETGVDGELVPQRRERYVFRPVLLRTLETYFQDSPFPDTAKRVEIANACNVHLQLDKKGNQLMPKEVVTPQVVANWFANKRKELRRKRSGTAQTHQYHHSLAAEVQPQQQLNILSSFNNFLPFPLPPPAASTAAINASSSVSPACYTSASCSSPINNNLTLTANAAHPIGTINNEGRPPNEQLESSRIEMTAPAVVDEAASLLNQATAIDVSARVQLQLQLLQQQQQNLKNGFEEMLIGSNNNNQTHQNEQQQQSALLMMPTLLFLLQQQQKLLRPHSLSSPASTAFWGGVDHIGGGIATADCGTAIPISTMETAMSSPLLNTTTMTTSTRSDSATTTMLLELLQVQQQQQQLFEQTSAAATSAILKHNGGNFLGRLASQKNTNVVDGTGMDRQAKLIEKTMAAAVTMVE